MTKYLLYIIIYYDIFIVYIQLYIYNKFFVKNINS